MKVSLMFSLGVAVCCIACPADVCSAQSAPNSLAYRPASPTSDQSQHKFTFLLFSKQDNANTQRVTADLSSAIAQRSDRAEWKAVNVADPANREIVERYQVGRAPMPLVLCVAPNGAITGAIVGRVTEKQIDAALVTPTMARCMKSLQAGKVVVVHVKSDAAVPLPAGAEMFLADPAFQNRATTESYVINDPAEDRFQRDLKIDPAKFDGSTVVVLAPPGVLVGKFPATITAAEIATKLHAAGKCCDDPNCKHSQKGQ